ncbi:MAG: maleylpyruvate isomerase family mycothiol-dependent enzyme [Microthrixaceae bacterium]
METATRVEAIPPITREEAEALARTEYTRVADQLRSLAPPDWTRPTDCPLWDVRAVAGHTAGMLSTFTSYRRLARTMTAATRAAKRSGKPMVDEMTAKQVADHAGSSTSELIAEIEAVGPRAARWRASRPALLRRMPMQEEVGGMPETWRLGYLLDIILTRDPWMHRVDIAGATGREMELTSQHDGRIIADVVAEWSRRHSQPFTLTLTGPAGGTYVAGDGGERLTIDAIEFCRTLSGRTSGSGLLAQEVPF